MADLIGEPGRCCHSLPKVGHKLTETLKLFKELLPLNNCQNGVLGDLYVHTNFKQTLISVIGKQIVFDANYFCCYSFYKDNFKPCFILLSCLCICGQSWYPWILVALYFFCKDSFIPHFILLSFTLPQRLDWNLQILVELSESGRLLRKWVLTFLSLRWSLVFQLLLSDLEIS